MRETVNSGDRHSKDVVGDGASSPALAYHEQWPSGKTGTLLTKPINNISDLSQAYSPGVAEPVLAIRENPQAAYRYTSKGHLVAVATNGTAVLGLGSIGALAAKPVMEGKVALLKRFAGLDAIDIEIEQRDPNRVVETLEAIAPTFGAIMLEDFCAPDCFQIEDRLQSLLDIPVFHDDQHGTAIAVAAALLNACSKTGRALRGSKVVINGAGAAGIACGHMLLALGLPEEQLWMCDVQGILRKQDIDSLHLWHAPFVRDTELSTLEEAAREADILIGLSVEGAFSQQTVRNMAANPIIFALANPGPEILPAVVEKVRSDALVATGRSDLPNQVNNLLAFPYVLRGAMQVRARRISQAMKVAAVECLAQLGSESDASHSDSHSGLLPDLFDDRLGMVAEAVANAATEEGLSTGIVRELASEFSVPPPGNAEENGSYRVESDSLGAVQVPASRYYGPQTARAIANFDISGRRLMAFPEMIHSLAWVKKAAALTNVEYAGLASELGNAICQACDEICAGGLHDEFQVDVLQGGAGTSTNMNANEVIANRALEILGHSLGRYDILHPNDHVNRSQSTNDAYATAVRMTMYQLCNTIQPALSDLVKAFAQKADEFACFPKLGRTQLQDAVPMSVGDEFSSFAHTLNEDVERLREVRDLFLEINLGGTAIGTGIGASPEYQEKIVTRLAEVSGIPVIRAHNRIEATWDVGTYVSFSGVLKRLATKLSKICNDLRLLSSGPVGGFGELCLPQRQPGSSIMPGKVNPVIPEVMNQVCFRVFGADTTVTFAAESGQLQLNAMEPVILECLHDSCHFLTRALRTLADNCIRDIRINREHCIQVLQQSTACAVKIAEQVGYDVASKLAKQAAEGKVSLLDIVRQHYPELGSAPLSWSQP